MKKLLTIVALLVSTLACHAQAKEVLKDVSEFTFYGIDFSHVKVCGAEETPAQFVAVFERINNLFINEGDKYAGKLQKKLKKQITQIDLEPVRIKNEAIDQQHLQTSDRLYKPLTDEEAAQAVKELNIPDKEGTGMVMIALKLNKADGKGAYQFVFFNNQTKAVITSWVGEGKAGGFGLRNYWANTVHNAFQKIKLK